MRNLARLKQHLLEKELEDSEKMDQDSACITELQAQLDARNDRVLQLEKYLARAIENQEEIKKSNIDELQKANEVISDLRQKLSGCVSVLESKNVELQNLQTVLGQYYAESDAKDRVFGELASAREEIIKLSEDLKAANHGIQLKNKEKEEILDKLALAEKRLSESQQRAGKFEEEVPLYNLYEVSNKTEPLRCIQLEILKEWRDNKSILLVSYAQFSGIVFDKTENAKIAGYQS